MIKDNLPLSTLTPTSTLAPLSKKWYEEVLTAHNISTLLLIRAYIAEKDTGSVAYTINRRLGFCKLIQHLLQSPDLSFAQFVSVITDSKYNLSQAVLNRFNSNVTEVVSSDVDILLNFITESERFIIEPLPGVFNAISIHRCCPVGVFFRKMIVFLDKLTFSQTVKVYRLYQQYYLMSKGSIQEDTFAPIPHSSSIMADEKKTHSVNITQPNESDMIMQDSHADGNDMEISVATQSPFTNPIVTLFGVNPVPDSSEKYVECLSWSHRQTELFLAEQAMFLEFDENSALPPLELHRILNRIIVINPDYSEAYFVSYLNCLRVKEFSGALENLFQFFDNVNYQDKAKGYRYAALNLAILSVKFGNVSGAISALKECIILSHETNDNICLHIAQAWLRCLHEDKKVDLIESTVSKCDELELHQIASLSLQMCAQNFLKTGQKGNQIFNLLDKSDGINSQRTLSDLTLTSVSHRAAIWCSYGQYNIAFLISQILLNIDTTYAIFGLTTYNTEGVCACICNVAGFLSNVGKYQIAKMVLTHAKDRFPHEYSTWWKMSEQLLYFEYSMHLNLWNDAHKAACQIATVDKKESLLRLAELSLEKGDRTGAAKRIDDILSNHGDKNNHESDLSPHYLLRAYLIGARAKKGGAAFFMLRKALTYAIRYGYPRFKALIKLEIAKLQLELGYVKQASQLVEKSSVIIFSENKLCEQAAALTLLAKCNVALVRHLNNSSQQKIDGFKVAINKLESAKNLYQRLECMTKVKDVVYLQVILSNEIGWNEARNAFALEFRRVDTEQNQAACCSIDFCNSL